MQSISRAIGRVLVNAGISAILVRAKQGPMTLTFAIRLVDPTRTQLTLVEGFGPLLGQHIGVGPVRVSIGTGQIIIEFPSPVPMTPSAFMLAEKGQGRNIAIGFDHWADPVYWNIARYKNLLVIGPPLAGKSSAMRSILYQIVRDSRGKVEYIIIAERAITWGVFKEIAGCVAVYLTAEAGAKALLDLTRQMEEKAGLGEVFSPALVIILDDLMSLLQAEKDIAKAITRLATAGGQIGVHLIMGTQSAGSIEATGGMAIEDSFMARLVYRTQNAGAAYRATGASNQGVEELTTVAGDALFIAGHERVRVATGYVTSDHILSDLPGRGEIITSVPLLSGNTAVLTTSDTANIQTVSLPRIKPARMPNAEETAQILAYLAINKVSQNKLLISLYNGKNGGYRIYLAQALGQVWDSLKNS